MKLHTHKTQSIPFLYNKTLHWRQNERVGVSDHQPHHCFPNCLFRHRSKKISKLRITGLCAGNSLLTGQFPAQRASNTKNVSIWRLHHDIYICREKLSLCYVDTPQFWSLLVFLSPGWHLTLVIQSTCPANILLGSSCGNVSPRDRKMMSPGYWDRVLSSHHDWEEYFWTRISIFYLQFLIEIDTKIILNQLWV